MRFVDEAWIKCHAGHGGRGCIAFRREKFVPNGGPSGGDGGRGGDIYFQATTRLATLLDFKYRRTFNAPNGEAGSGSNKAGRDAEDIVVQVPIGTVIKDRATGNVLADLSEEHQRVRICSGGRGGKGNAHFATSTKQAPRYSQPGEEGEIIEIALELKLLADVGIVGHPNAGKSTLISRLSAARPKIADYPFTTLTPQLGVVQIGEYDHFTIADVPGLVEGAHEGVGLGIRFLKHLERTKLLVHLLDGAHLIQNEDFNAAIEKLAESHRIIRSELSAFSEDLYQKPEIVVLNKTDLLTDVEAARLALAKALDLSPDQVYAISAATLEGVQEIKMLLWTRLGTQPHEESAHFTPLTHHQGSPHVASMV